MWTPLRTPKMYGAMTGSSAASGGRSARRPRAAGAWCRSGKPSCQRSVPVGPPRARARPGGRAPEWSRESDACPRERWPVCSDRPTSAQAGLDATPSRHPLPPPTLSERALSEFAIEAPRGQIQDERPGAYRRQGSVRAGHGNGPARGGLRRSSQAAPLAWTRGRGREKGGRVGGEGRKGGRGGESKGGGGEEVRRRGGGGGKRGGRGRREERGGGGGGGGEEKGGGKGEGGREGGRGGGERGGGGEGGVGVELQGRKRQRCRHAVAHPYGHRRPDTVGREADSRALDQHISGSPRAPPSYLRDAPRRHGKRSASRPFRLLAAVDTRWLRCDRRPAAR